MQRNPVTTTAGGSLPSVTKRAWHGGQQHGGQSTTERRNRGIRHTNGVTGCIPSCGRRFCDRGTPRPRCVREHHGCKGPVLGVR